MPQQRIQIRLAAPEGFERFQRRAATARFQNGLAVQASGFHAGRVVGCGGFVEQGQGLARFRMPPRLGLKPLQAMSPAKPGRPRRIRTKPSIPIKLTNKIMAHWLRVGMGAVAAAVARICAAFCCT